MLLQNFYHWLLGWALLSIAFTTGLLFTFAVLIMPGIGRLDDRGFVRAFQVIDGVIQNGQILFGLVWVGSVVSLLAASIVGLWQLEGAGKWLLLFASLLYLGGVQLPTFRTNVPLNNTLQSFNVSNADDVAVAAARVRFESPWNRSNHIRTVMAIFVSILLVAVILSLRR